MKTKLFFLLFLATVGVHAQTSHMVDWFLGVPLSQTSISINAGDSVVWTWTDDMPHTVSSFPSANQTFESGALSGVGQIFTQIFPNAGVSEYRCIFHSGMVGVITVQPDMKILEQKKRSYSYYPNPVNDIFTVAANQGNIDRITLFDGTGKQLMDAYIATPEAKIYMSKYPKGNYFVKIQSENNFETISIIHN